MVAQFKMDDARQIIWELGMKMLLDSVLFSDLITM